MAAQEDLRRETGAMKEEARAMWNDAADVARSAARQQQQAAAQGIGSFAGALREAARHTDGGAGTSARVAETIADGLDRVSNSLKGRDLNALIRDVEDFARSQPLVFFSAAVATGFIAMRFLKSSTPDSAARYDEGRSLSPGSSGAMAGTGAGYESMRTSGSVLPRGDDSALADPDAMQRGVGTRPDASRQSHATEFERDAGVMAAHDAGTARTVASSADNPASAGPRGNATRGGAAPNVWPDVDPVEKESSPSGRPSGAGR